LKKFGEAQIEVPDEVRTKISPIFLRRKKAEVLDELPPRVDETYTMAKGRSCQGARTHHLYERGMRFYTTHWEKGERSFSKTF